MTGVDLGEHEADVREPQDIYTPTQTVDRVYGPLVGAYPGSETEVHESPVGTGESYGWWATAQYGLEPVYDEGGMQGWTRTLPYSIGPVASELVEDFELRGRIFVPGRPVEEGDGPVGIDTYRSNLILQIVQAMGPEVTDEMQAIGLLSGM